MHTTAVPESGGDAEGQSSLTRFDLGVKYQPAKAWQLVLGVNDLFNKEQDMYDENLFDRRSYMLKYPKPGRTYYATVQYSF
jgi:vitamin B12 transporter